MKLDTIIGCDIMLKCVKIFHIKMFLKNKYNYRACNKKSLVRQDLFNRCAYMHVCIHIYTYICHIIRIDIYILHIE